MPRKKREGKEREKRGKIRYYDGKREEDHSLGPDETWTEEITMHWRHPDQRQCLALNTFNQGPNWIMPSRYQSFDSLIASLFGRSMSETSHNLWKGERCVCEREVFAQ